MKKNLLSIATILGLGIIACNGPSQAPDTAVTQIASEKQTETLDSSAYLIKVRLFKHSGLDFDGDGFCVNGQMTEKEKITEVKSVESGSNVKCAEGQYIQKIIFEGNAFDITLVFFDKSGKELFRKENFKLDNTLSFSCTNHTSDGSGADNQKREADFAEWFENAAKVQILYKGQAVKEVGWKNNGWFRQAGGGEIE